MNRFPRLAALSGIVAVILASAPAHAQDITVWRPVTAAGGAPVDPSFWNNQASVRFNGGAGSQSSVTVNPTIANSTYFDYSNKSTAIAGSQTNVTANGQLANGGTFAVTTQEKPMVTDTSTTNNTTNSTVVSSTSTLGTGSTLTNATTNTNN